MSNGLNYLTIWFTDFTLYNVADVIFCFLTPVGVDTRCSIPFSGYLFVER